MGHFTAQIKFNKADRDSDIIKCESFNDIPFEDWNEYAGQLVLRFPQQGHEANITLEQIDGEPYLRYIGTDTSYVPFNKEGVQYLIANFDKRMEEVFTYLNVPKSISEDKIKYIQSVTVSIIKEFGSTNLSDKWGVPLAMLAGVGILAALKPAKSNNAVAESSKEMMLAEEYRR